MSNSKNQPKTQKKSQLKSAVPPVFILPSHLPPTSDQDKIFGLEIKRAVEAVFNISESENSNAVECVCVCVYVCVCVLFFRFLNLE